MIAALDVHYGATSARAAGVMFRDWTDAQALEERVVPVQGVAAYEPGQFYRRELPCLLAVLGALPPAPIVIVDGFVWLEAGQPGLGAHLHEALRGGVAIVGVAKTLFRSAEPIRTVTRGESHRPLYVSAVGMNLDAAANSVRTMHGPYRIPTLIKRVDTLCRYSGASLDPER